MLFYFLFHMPPETKVQMPKLDHNMKVELFTLNRFQNTIVQENMFMIFINKNIIKNARKMS